MGRIDESTVMCGARTNHKSGMDNPHNYVLTCNRVALHQYDPEAHEPMRHECYMGNIIISWDVETKE